MAVELGVLRHGQSTHVGHGGQADRAGEFGARMLHNDHNRWAALRQFGVLEGAGFHTARHHKAGVSIAGHAIGGLGIKDRLSQLMAG